MGRPGGRVIFLKFNKYTAKISNSLLLETGLTWSNDRKRGWLNKSQE